MNVTEKGDTFNCSCGFSWQRGQSGAHNCEPGLYRQITALQQKLDAVTADNFGLSSAAYTLLQMLNEPEGLPDAIARMEKALENPATDAQVNALRAEEMDSLAGVAKTMLIKFSNACATEIPESIAWSIVKRHAETRAAQLRNGERVGEEGL